MQQGAITVNFNYRLTFRSNINLIQAGTQRLTVTQQFIGCAIHSTKNRERLFFNWRYSVVNAFAHGGEHSSAQSVTIADFAIGIKTGDAVVITIATMFRMLQVTGYIPCSDTAIDPAIIIKRVATIRKRAIKVIAKDNTCWAIF
ncbi:hypothetical protein NM74_04850 [Aeromonas hydrophila]|nr:hypothetical protein NM74_04850 [Aeromonas hydrophila]